jgi:hypothetical protein
MLWEWDKQLLTPEELYNKFFSAKDGLDYTAWHATAEDGQLEVLHKLLEWVKSYKHHRTKLTIFLQQIKGLTRGSREGPTRVIAQIAGVG